MKTKIQIMLQMQDSMNKKVHAEWQAQNYEWFRAIWIECAELMDHHGWKWWKKQQLDREQVVLELIDIWHFGLSSLLQGTANHVELVEKLNQEIDFAPVSKPFLELVEEFACETLQTQQFNVAKFIPLLVAMDVSFDHLYRSYIGKNVLNFFRQDHGYKDGSYRKVWQGGKEDNEHLVEVLVGLDAESITFQQDLYIQLQLRYGQI